MRGVNLKTDSRSERSHMVFFTGRNPSPLCFVIVERVEALSCGWDLILSFYGYVLNIE